MGLEEARKPSLWMKRFDRSVDEQGVRRLAVESLYSLADITRPGAYMTHVQAVAALANAYERAGEVDWREACQALSPWADPDELFEGLRTDADRLRALPDLLNEMGLPQKTLNHPRIRLGQLDATLKGWGLR